MDPRIQRNTSGANGAGDAPFGSPQQRSMQQRLAPRWTAPKAIGAIVGIAMLLGALLGVAYGAGSLLSGKADRTETQGAIQEIRDDLTSVQSDVKWLKASMKRIETQLQAE